MSIRKINFSNDEYYHIYNRGNNKQILFRDTQDKQRFIKLLYVMNQENRKRLSDMSREDIFTRVDDPLVAIGAYVIMDNHFHILLRQVQDGGVTRFMQKVGTAYASYFNVKYKRTGSLYEGRFKAKHATDDRYLKYLYSYIHLNPAKLINKNWKNEILVAPSQSEILTFLKDYKYSSFQDYVGILRPEGKLLSKNTFPAYFGDSKDTLKNILMWLELK